MVKNNGRTFGLNLILDWKCRFTARTKYLKNIVNNKTRCEPEVLANSNVFIVVYSQLFLAESKFRKLHQPSQRPGSTLSIPCPWSSRRTTRALLQGKPGPHTLAPSWVQLHPPPKIPDFQILQINFLEHWSTSVHLSAPVPVSRTCRKEGSVPSVTVVVLNRTGSVDSSAFQEQLERDWLLETPVIVATESVASGVVKVGDCSKDL